MRGTIACASSRDDGPVHFRAEPGIAIGALESIAGQPRWHDAVAETEVEVLEHDIDDFVDIFEDNVEMATDFLAWVSRDALNLIETIFGPGPELLDFFTGSQATVSRMDASSSRRSGAGAAFAGISAWPQSAR